MCRSDQEITQGWKIKAFFLIPRIATESDKYQGIRKAISFVTLVAKLYCRLYKPSGA